MTNSGTISFGDIKPFASKIKDAGITLITQVQTVKQAIYDKEQGADIIVAQGSEAGGHGANRGTMALVPAVVDSVGTTPVVAAGGICDGRGIAASMMLGAQGVLLGTLFCASLEANGIAATKKLLIESNGDQTIRSELFDIVDGYDWPKPYTARAIKNKFSERWQGKAELSDKITKNTQDMYKQAKRNSDLDIAAIFAGEGLDLIHDILPAIALDQQFLT
ncbi:Nitronate monooxygenase [Piscirickettsia salmonis]|uniref:NAD(P)H-dependent flavin oxidoreductase n=1 Tax=Piscirickettsia salmonis TaxID=1238 RepID=UPI0012BAAE47|nr:nitronate monooxygenase [Piscirickettsia salmonis]QGP54398.1 Nitronate monooxygenase [Piscirickettsia salmonis]QGP59714.1 Nitronate monooxygenase [Piscirickettsia salmonis]QGP64406.1 Nitronate monooxygenase [Piscirickettsia salmonis]